jgi:glucokinase
MHLTPEQDQRIVMTLDAGGTNFVFSAIRGNKEVVTPLSKPVNPDNLEDILKILVDGFENIALQLPGLPDAVSFAFPGPADYPRGIIGDLPNLKAFRGGVAIGPMLEDHFRIPVYINNDGNLFAYGEALAGFLPELNRRLADEGSLNVYRSLIGMTIGTGFGAGIVVDQKMIAGDCSCGGEIHHTQNIDNPSWNAEESISTRAIQRVYAEMAGVPFSKSLMPKHIYDIAHGNRGGDFHAARESFNQFGRALGNSIAGVLALIDGIVVIGGGIAAAWDLFSPFMFREINRNYKDHLGNPLPRLSFNVYDLENPSSFKEFAGGRVKTIKVPVTGNEITYDDLPRSGVGKSRLGASRAIALGAYAFALQQLDRS